MQSTVIHSLTRADGFLRSEASLRVLRGDALDGRQGDISVCAGQPRGLRLFSPTLQVAWLQGIGPAPPTTHVSAPGLFLLPQTSSERNTRTDLPWISI